MTAPPPLLPLQPKEFASTLWFKRNWRWIVPAGAVVAAACFLVFLLGIAAVMKTSDAYLVPLSRARSAPAVIARLGEPMREGWFVEGTIHLTNNDGTAELSFPLLGPRGRGTVCVGARKTSGRWDFRQVVVVLAGGQQVDLSDPPSSDPGPAHP